jgi:hypothetical protein
MRTVGRPGRRAITVAFEAAAAAAGGEEQHDREDDKHERRADGGGGAGDLRDGGVDGASQSHRRERDDQREQHPTLAPGAGAPAMLRSDWVQEDRHGERAQTAQGGADNVVRTSMRTHPAATSHSQCAREAIHHTPRPIAHQRLRACAQLDMQPAGQPPDPQLDGLALTTRRRRAVDQRVQEQRRDHQALRMDVAQHAMKLGVRLERGTHVRWELEREARQGLQRTTRRIEHRTAVLRPARAHRRCPTWAWY